MQTHADFFPRICFPDDLSKMTLAHRGVMAQIGCAGSRPRRGRQDRPPFLRMGVVDEKRSAEAIGQVARSLAGYVPGLTRPLGRRQYSRQGMT